MKKTLIAFLLGLLLTSNVQAKNDDIVTTAARNGSFNTLTSLLVATGLDEALKNEGDFTVFAPNDEAFAKLPKSTLDALRKPANKEKLAGILKYHVVNRSLSVSKKAPSHPLKSVKTLQGERIRFERNGSQVNVNGNHLIARNIRCSNGFIQVIDGVLLPPEPNTIADVAAKAGNFNTLLTAVKAAGLTDALTGSQPLTVFAPTDAAFNKLPKGTVQKLLKPENKEMLKAILTYHVVKGSVDAKSAITAGKAKTLNGQSITAKLNEGRLQINQSNVIKNDIQTDNGIIHVIDNVLLPAEQKPKTSASKRRSRKHH